MSFLSAIRGAALLGGLAMSAGYYAYCVFLTGREADEVVPRMSGSAYQDIGVNLDPSMNGVALRFKGYAESPYAGKEDRTLDARIRYSVTDGQSEIHSGVLGFENVAREGSKNFTNYSDVFEAPRASRYTIRFSGNAREPVHVKNLRVVVRRNVREPNMKVVLWGGGLFVVGLLLGMFTGAAHPVAPKD